MFPRVNHVTVNCHLLWTLRNIFLSRILQLLLNSALLQNNIIMFTLFLKIEDFLQLQLLSGADKKGLFKSVKVRFHEEVLSKYCFRWF